VEVGQESDSEESRSNLLPEHPTESSDTPSWLSTSSISLLQSPTWFSCWPLGLSGHTLDPSSSSSALWQRSRTNLLLLSQQCNMKMGQCVMIGGGQRFSESTMLLS